MGRGKGWKGGKGWQGGKTMADGRPGCGDAASREREEDAGGERVVFRCFGSFCPRGSRGRGVDRLGGLRRAIPGNGGNPRFLLPKDARATAAAGAEEGAGDWKIRKFRSIREGGGGGGGFCLARFHETGYKRVSAGLRDMRPGHVAISQTRSHLEKRRALLDGCACVLSVSFSGACRFCEFARISKAEPTGDTG